jgi:hypothetical protein
MNNPRLVSTISGDIHCADRKLRDIVVRTMLALNRLDSLGRWLYYADRTARQHGYPKAAADGDVMAAVVLMSGALYEAITNIQLLNEHKDFLARAAEVHDQALVDRYVKVCDPKGHVQTVLLHAIRHGAAAHFGFHRDAPDAIDRILKGSKSPVYSTWQLADGGEWSHYRIAEEIQLALCGWDQGGEKVQEVINELSDATTDFMLVAEVLVALKLREFGCEFELVEPIAVMKSDLKRRRRGPKRRKRKRPPSA